MKSIYFRNFLSTALMVLLSFLIVGTALVFMGQGFIISSHRDDMKAIATAVAHMADSAGYEDFTSWDVRISLSVAAKISGNDMLVTNSDGLILSCSDDPGRCRHIGLHVASGEMEELARGGELNSVTDLDLMEKLRDASRAGVEITMIVRGICCILPGIPGETENLHIRSIVGRYLEHSRVYCFGEGASEKMYIASADFMTRNTERRVEVACPIYDKRVQEKIHHILALCLQDNIRARILEPDGSYSHVPGGEVPIDCQKQLMADAIDASVPVEGKPTLWSRVKDAFSKKKS